MWYLVRYKVLKPLRLAVFWLAELVSFVPHTTYGEIAEMHRGPCGRCVGRRVEASTPSTIETADMTAPAYSGGA